MCTRADAHLVSSPRFVLLVFVSAGAPAVCMYGMFMMIWRASGPRGRFGSWLVVWHVAHIDICWGGDIAFLRCRASSLMDSDSFGGGGRAPRTVAQAGA